MTRVNSSIDGDVQRIITSSLRGSFASLAGSTLLVTGASGFLCSYFLDTLAALNDAGLDPPCKVLAVDNLQTGLSERVAHLEGRGDVVFLNHDVTRDVERLGAVDWIIHGASIASPSFYRRYPLETIDVNVVGTRKMLDLARGDVRGMLYLSSSEIYGDPDPASIPTPEDYRGNVSSTGPRACYDESKRLAETLCMTYHRLYATPVKVVRPFNVYGPGQRLDDRRIIPDVMRSVVKREPIVLFSDGRTTRSFCYIRDAVQAMWHVLLSDADGEVFNIGNDGEEVTIGHVAKLMKEIADPIPVEIRYQVSDDPNYLTDNPQRRCPDLKKLRARFQWEPEVSLAEGLRRTLHSYLVPIPFK